MFKKQFAAILLAVLMMATLGNAEEIGGINMPESLQTGQTTLMLNGAGSSMVTSKKMEKAWREGFEKATGGNIEPIKVQIEELISVFREEIKENDSYDMVYVPGKGVQVSKNSESRPTIGGLPFKKALFGIWLSDKPAQKSLKKAMLGE
jgi:hypothetical protein